MKGRPEHDFRAACEMLECILRAGAENAVEKVLDEHESIAGDEDWVVELIYLEYLIRKEEGESPTVKDYVQRFAKYESRIQRVFSIDATLVSEQNLTQLDSEAPLFPRRLGPGDVVGSFELLSSLGAGGRGFVFKARQLELDRIVALKVLRVNATDHRDFARFLVEAKATAKLVHPSIVQVYESDVYENLPYIALEYLPGGTLEQRLSSGPIGAKDATELTAVLANALQYAHEQGIVHRDIKPSNILHTQTGAPKIADFGLAKRSHFTTSAAPPTLTETGAVLGTPSYMAPEQAEGRNRDVGPATDVYGLGVVLYEMITGAVPFVGESTLDVLQSICTMDPVAPSLRNPKIPSDLETICLKCLEKEPASRYTSAADLADDLDRFQTGRPIVARPAGIIQRISKLARRHPLTTTLIAGIVTSVIAVIALISWQWNQAANGKRTEALLRSAAEDALYANQIALAHKEIKSSESLRALEILNRTDQHRRHWEWDYLQQSCNTYRTLATLGTDTRRCIVSADGSLLVIVKGRWGTDEPGELTVFDANTRELLFRKSSRLGPIMDASISPDGQTIATVESRFVTGGGGATIYDAHSGEVKDEMPHQVGLFAVAFHPTRPQVALATDEHSIEIWDLDADRRLHELKGHRDTCYRIAYSPRGEQLASCSGDRTIRLWNTKSGKQEAVLHAQRDVIKVTYTPDGRYVAANGVEQAILIWDRMEKPPRRKVVHLAGEHPLSYDLSISQQGRYIMAFGDAGRRLYSYDVSVGRLNVRPAGTLNRPFWLACHPSDERLYVVDADGNVMESKSRSANPFRRYVTARATAIAANDEREFVAIASGTNRVLPGKRDFRCRLLPLANADATIRLFEGAQTAASSIALSADGGVLACGCEDGHVLQWKVDSGVLLGESAFHETKIVNLRFSTDGGRLTSVSSDGLVASWQSAAAQPTAKRRLPESSIRSAVTSSDGTRLLISSEQGGVSLYASGPLQQSKPADEPSGSTASALWQANYSGREVRAVALSPDHLYVAVATDSAIDLWAVDGSETSPVWSASMSLTSGADLAFHPDGQRLAIVDGWIGRVALLDSTNGQVVLELDVRSGNERAHITFSPNGMRLLATLGGEFYVWSGSDMGSEIDYSTGTQNSRSRYRTDFQWHVNQASEQIYGGLPLGAESHARRALRIIDHSGDKLQGMPAFEVLTLNAKCHLAKSLIELGQFEEGKEMLKEIIADCPDQYTPLHTIALLLATYPGPTVVSNATLQEIADRALQLKPDSGTALATAGLAYLQSREHEQAKNLLERAAEATTSWDGLALFPLAVLEARADHPQEAERLFARGAEWAESSVTRRPIIRELKRWAAEELALSLRR